MNLALRCLLIVCICSLAVTGCGDKAGSNAPEGAGLKGMDDAKSFQDAAPVPDPAK